MVNITNLGRDASAMPPLPPPILPILHNKRLQIPKPRQTQARIDELLNDPQIISQDVAHVTCKYCTRKIRIGTNYNMGSWKAHKSICKEPSMTPCTMSVYTHCYLRVFTNFNCYRGITDHSAAGRLRMSEDERFHKLKNDATVLTFGPRHVVCKNCYQAIRLCRPYGLTPWHRHKYTCQKKHRLVG